MAKKPTYEELEQRVEELEKKVDAHKQSKQAGEALRKEKNFTESLIDTAQVIILVLDTEGRIVRFNPYMEDLSGYKLDEVRGRDWFSTFLLEQDYDQIRELFRAAVSDIQTRGNINPIVAKDGREIIVEWYDKTLKDADGNTIGLLAIGQDITERKQSEEALRESEEKYRQLADLLPQTVFETDERGDLTFANRIAFDLFGYTRGDFEKGLNALNMLVPDGRDRALENIARVLKGEWLGGTEYTALTKNGNLFPVMTHTSPIISEDKTVGLRGIITDLTKLKEAEGALRKSEDRYRLLVETMSDGLAIYDENNLNTFCNNRFCQMLGYSRDEITGRPAKDFIDEINRKILEEQIVKRKKGEREPYEIDWVRKDGGKISTIVSPSPIFDDAGRYKGSFAVITDISEIKRGQRELQESKDNLDKAQKMAHIGNWSRDLNLNRVQWSDETYRIFGLTPGDPAQPSFETFLSRVHPKDRENVTSVLKEAAEKKHAFDFEFRTIPIEGSDRIIRDRGEVEYDETGTPSRIFGTDQDITETRKLQAQLLETQKLEAIATLAGGIAHQFNNALTPIIGHIDLLKMKHGEDENTKKSLKDMKKSGHHMAHLTSQLLAYAEGGKYNPQVLSLSDFVEASLPLIQHTFDPAVRVETDLPLDVMNVKADGSQMQMVLSAIMSNSNEAMEGPGRIRISTRNMDVARDFIKDHPGLKPGPYVCLSIEDDGKGMDEETRRKIFDPFFTTHFMGRGLGMAAVYGIIRNHDGEITVESKLGKGTIVRIYLPAIETEEEPKKAVVSKPEIELPTGDATILVIEDEEDVMMLIRQVLERLGYRVLQAETGKKAIKLAKTFDGQIDLAILNIKLPDMTGDKVYPLIMEARPDLKVVVCSGYTIEGPPQDILDAGAEGFVQKPFHTATLAEKMKEVLEGN